VECLVGRDDGCVGSEREMDSWERHQVGLEFVQIDVQGTVESQRGSDGRNDLSDQPVQVGVGRRLDAEVSSTNVVDTRVLRFISHHTQDTLAHAHLRLVVNHE
jgi:hypothetical protein